ncbi:hypothetical protein L9F63_004517 [Diploptera punctata]|uniref:DUF4817 domain-containing protein n=1 Tax=Diploptera punctata TaxID=6984 RepID=A0AAD7ZG78_DIPPU|nr:hypothetical protein L9F63_004517 [Diploptera punctata]
MATPQQKAFCILQFESCKSVVTVECAFRRQFNRDPPNANNIRRWHNQFATTGCLCKGKSVGRPRVSEKNVAAATFQARSQRNQQALEPVTIVNGRDEYVSVFVRPSTLSLLDWSSWSR